MQAGVPAKELRERGSPHAKLQTQEAAEETQWSFFCRADIFATASGADRPRRVCATAISARRSHRLLWTRAEIEVEDLAKRQNEGVTCSQKQERHNKRSGETSRRGLLPAAGSASVSRSSPDPESATKTSPFRDNRTSLRV